MVVDQLKSNIYIQPYTHIWQETHSWLYRYTVSLSLFCYRTSWPLDLYRGYSLKFSTLQGGHKTHKINICQRHTCKFDVHESVHRDVIVKVTNKMQLYGLIYYSKSALHVWGDVFAHHQEHLTVFTVYGSVRPSCCRLVSWMSWNWTMWTVRRHAAPPTW